MSTLTISLVLATNGSVDEKATEQAFRTSLSKYIAERETELTHIAAAVKAVFDQYKGQRINMPALASFTVQRLNAQPENFKTLETRVMEYVRTNSQGEKSEDGSVSRPDSLFVIGKGKDGGVRRRADIPAKA